MEDESSLSSSLSPLRKEDKIQSRYLSPHLSSCHDFCKHGKKHVVESEVNSLNFRKFVKERKKLSQSAEKNQTKMLENTKSPGRSEVSKSASNHNEKIRVKSLESDDNTSDTTIKKITSPAAPNVTQTKKPTSRIEAQKHKQITTSHKKVNGEGKITSITLRNKAPLVRSLSKNKSLLNLSLRRKHESEIKKTSTAILDVTGDESSIKSVKEDQNEKATKSLESLNNYQKITMKSKKPQENISSSFLRKVKSIKRTSSSHGSVFKSQLRKVRSIKKTTASNKHPPSYPLKEFESIKNVLVEEKIPSAKLSRVKSLKKNSLHSEKFQVPQLRKVKSIKKNSSPRNGDSSLQPTKLKSISRNRPSNDDDSSSSQLLKLKSSKKESSHNESISNMISRKFMSIMRSSSVKHKNRSLKPAVQSNSNNVDMASNIKAEESPSAVNKVLNSKKRLPKSSSTRTEETNTAPFKLKFRRGTVINLRSNSINGAKRLWLNIGQLGNNENTLGNGLLRKRSIRKKRGSFGSRDFEIHSVVLKHQKTMDKKDEKLLFNDVIEETASKLVETKKSKVKALVGAFETVISLQESKPVSSF